jgi:hypothetical protein
MMIITTVLFLWKGSTCTLLVLPKSNFVICGFWAKVAFLARMSQQLLLVACNVTEFHTKYKEQEVSWWENYRLTRFENVQGSKKYKYIYKNFQAQPTEIEGVMGNLSICTYLHGIN